MSKKSSYRGFDIKFEGLNKNSDGSFSAPGRYEPKNKGTARAKHVNTVDPKLFEGIDSNDWGSGGVGKSFADWIRFRKVSEGNDKQTNEYIVERDKLEKLDNENKKNNKNDPSGRFNFNILTYYDYFKRNRYYFYEGDRIVDIFFKHELNKKFDEIFDTFKKLSEETIVKYITDNNVVGDDDRILFISGLDLFISKVIEKKKGEKNIKKICSSFRKANDRFKEMFPDHYPQLLIPKGCPKVEQNIKPIKPIEEENKGQGEDLEGQVTEGQVTEVQVTEVQGQDPEGQGQDPEGQGQDPEGPPGEVNEGEVKENKDEGEENKGGSKRTYKKRKTLRRKTKRRNAVRRKTKRRNAIRRSHIKSKKRTLLKNRRH